MEIDKSSSMQISDLLADSLYAIRTGSRKKSEKLEHLICAVYLDATVLVALDNRSVCIDTHTHIYIYKLTSINVAFRKSDACTR